MRESNCFTVIGAEFVKKSDADKNEEKKDGDDHQQDGVGHAAGKKGKKVDSTGTGVVHCAPGFGEEDYSACRESKLISPEAGSAVMPMDDDGKFLPSVPDYEGIYFKEADKEIIKHLKDKGRILGDAGKTIEHRYPHCYRCETPLM